jgi:hypothetical protein
MSKHVIFGPQHEPLICTEQEARNLSDSVAAAPQTGWKKLGIGYGPLGGQQFPESASLEMMKGPQGEDLRPLCDSAVTAGSDRNLMELFADDRFSPYSVELASEDGGDVSDPQQALRWRVRYSDGEKLDSIEFGQDELDELSDEAHEKLRALPGGSMFKERD